ncbi:MAG: hypothetical protein IKD99_07420 [Erysipelotrichaceae bacterium]|nr:hypothetical protein [Erysipelotrichaceae bacterium]
MAYRSTQEMIKMLESKEYLQEKLYVNGFLITNHDFEITDEYPFYGNWYDNKIGDYNIYFHKNANLTLYQDDNTYFFILGHAVDPFDDLYTEDSVLKKMAIAYRKGIDEYYEAQSDLTGIYCTGIISTNEIYVSNDCTGMQIVYYGTINGSVYFSSHSKLIADLLGLEQNAYIKKLVSSKFYHYMGTWLPGDLSPYSELTRLVPNHYVHMNKQKECSIVRFFPVEKIIENADDDSYQNSINCLADILHKTLYLYSKKWDDKKVSISITGGRDSTTTLACANGLYDSFNYFSYISNDSERVDALAAEQICSQLGLNHDTYVIPTNDIELLDVDVFATILECNSGCIGEHNRNDVRKRLYFIQNPKYDIEIKSWVNELGRASQYTKYNKKSFPKEPTVSYCRALHKIYISPKLIHETDLIFDEYLKKYYSNDAFEKAPWMELFWWEFCWSGGEGIFLTSEHRTSSEIAIPYNNRRYVERMLTVPLEKRITDSIPIDIIKHMNPEIAKTGVVVKNIKHTDKRALLMRIYLEIFSRIHF